jgi:hypothetical protein
MNATITTPTVRRNPYGRTYPKSLFNCGENSAATP